MPRKRLVRMPHGGRGAWASRNGRALIGQRERAWGGRSWGGRDGHVFLFLPYPESSRKPLAQVTQRG